MKAVLHAHPDRWTVGLDRHLPPEERDRLRSALVAFALDVLGPTASIEEAEGAVEDDDSQRAALARWRARDDRDLAGALAAALDAVLCGALWDSPVFPPRALSLRFHPGWRVIVEGAADVQAPATRHGLLLRDR